jgi:hypothetical protein
LRSNAFAVADLQLCVAVRRLKFGFGRCLSRRHLFAEHVSCRVTIVDVIEAAGENFSKLRWQLTVITDSAQLSFTRV